MIRLFSLQETAPVSVYSNPELDMISKDIDELAKERRLLEIDITQKEADIKVKTGEVKSLQVFPNHIIVIIYF